MARPGDHRRRISIRLNSAYGDGLLSQSTHAHRLDVLLSSRVIDPERLIGDLPLRRPWSALLRALAGWRVRSMPPLLALDWSGATDELLLGRHPECDVILEDRTVSRRHARLTFRDGAWIIQDLGSRNGTWVNRAPVARCRLAPGDVVSVGGQSLLVD